MYAHATIGAADVVLVVGSKLGVTDTAYANPKLLDPRRQTLITAVLRDFDRLAREP